MNLIPECPVFVLLTQEASKVRCTDKPHVKTLRFVANDKYKKVGLYERSEAISRAVLCLKVSLLF